MARVIESVIGHESKVEKLLHLKKTNRWPHAFMFVGPSGIGKKKLALAFAQVLICPESTEACGLCGPCLRIEKMQCESLLLLEPDPELSRPVIKVEKVRDLLRSLSFAPLGISRVVIIDQAQTLNAQASNALLKTLEEPTENIYFILIANDQQQLLPTIRSRTQVMRFFALPYDQVKKIKPNLADWVYHSSRGQIDRAELLSSAEGASRRENALNFFAQFCQDNNFLAIKSWKDSVKDRAWALFSINCWLQMLRDAVVLKTQTAGILPNILPNTRSNRLLNTDQVERLKLLCSLSANKLLWLGQGLVLAEKDINANVDPILVFESLWVRYARVD